MYRHVKMYVCLNIFNFDFMPIGSDQFFLCSFMACVSMLMCACVHTCMCVLVLKGHKSLPDDSFVLCLSLSIVD